LLKLSKKRRIEYAGFWWLTPVIIIIQEVEIRRIAVRSQHEQMVHKTIS
jgi:hypothetical protein